MGKDDRNRTKNFKMYWANYDKIFTQDTPDDVEPPKTTDTDED